MRKYNIDKCIAYSAYWYMYSIKMSDNYKYFF